MVCSNRSKRSCHVFFGTTLRIHIEHYFSTHLYVIVQEHFGNVFSDVPVQRKSTIKRIIDHFYRYHNRIIIVQTGKSDTEGK